MNYCHLERRKFRIPDGGLAGNGTPILERLKFRITIKASTLGVPIENAGGVLLGNSSKSPPSSRHPPRKLLAAAGGWISGDEIDLGSRKKVSFMEHENLLPCFLFRICLYRIGNPLRREGRQLVRTRSNFFRWVECLFEQKSDRNCHESQ